MGKFELLLSSDVDLWNESNSRDKRKIRGRRKQRSLDSDFFERVERISEKDVFKKLGIKFQSFPETSMYSLRASCVFCKDQTPSFFVLRYSLAFHCFGCGETVVGVFNFVLLYFKKDFTKTCRWFNRCFGIPLPWK